MIDTDKYEGHTEGPWSVEYPMLTPSEPNRKLIDDAPLLLAELKRVLKVMSKIGCSLCDECGLSIEEHIRYHTENDVIAGCPFGED